MKFKIPTLIVFIIFLSCFNSCRRTYNIPFTEKIKIIRIDSIENTYIIYAKRNISDAYPPTFRILSSKGKTNICNNRIEKDKVYKMSLLNLMMDNMSATIIGHINFNGSKIPVKEYNISKTMYVSKNLKGLCYRRFVLKSY